jgi:type VI protein secretion system component VasK
LKSKNPAEFSDAAVAYLNVVFKLQQAFFPGGQQPKINYSLSVKPPPTKKVEVKADGVTVTADGSVSNGSLSWPQTTGEAGIKVLVSSKEAAVAVGQTAAPGATEAANHPGLWGVFRMTAGNKYQFTWGDVSATLQPPSNNPFALNFSALRAPDSFR